MSDEYTRQDRVLWVQHLGAVATGSGAGLCGVAAWFAFRNQNFLLAWTAVLFVLGFLTGCVVLFVQMERSFRRLKRVAPEEARWLRQWTSSRAGFVLGLVFTVFCASVAARHLCLASDWARALGNPVTSWPFPGFVEGQVISERVGVGVYLVLSLGFIGVALYCRWWSRRARRELWYCRGCCVRCGYSLTGLTEPRCPECGTPFAARTGDAPRRAEARDSEGG